MCFDWRMNKMNFINTALLAVILSSPAIAMPTNWMLFSSSDATGDEVYIDIDGIRDLSSSVKMAWLKIDHKKNKDTKARETKVLWHFQCERYEIKEVQWIRYAPNGKLIGSGSAPPYREFEVAAPETVGYAALEIVCFS